MKAHIKFKGVYPIATGKNYRCIIYVDKKQFYIGTFKTIKEAAIAYDQKAFEIFGEFAWLNYPNELKKDVV